MSYNTLFKLFTGAAAIGVRCPSCFLDFAIPESLHTAYRQKHGVEHLYCPSCGKTMIPLGQTEAEKLRDQLAREKHWREQAEARSSDERSRRVVAERQAAARKGVVTKIRNRVGNGVCPVCTRTFGNLARHMGCKHPDYAKADA